MDDKLKKMSFKDFTVVNPSMTDDEYLAYQAQKRRRGHFDTQGESVEHVDEAKAPSTVKHKGKTYYQTGKTGKDSKTGHPSFEYSSDLDGDDVRVWYNSKTKKVAMESVEHMGTVEEKTLHINLDAKDSPRQKQVTSVLKRHEKSGAIEFDGETDKGALFKINKPGVEKSINKELSRLGGGYQLGESVEQVDEVMDRTARIKASQRMKRMSKRIQMAKKRALKRAPNTDVIKSRAQRQARNQMMSKYTKGVPKSELSIARRTELEKRLKKMKGRVDKMAKKLIPTIRKQDRERRSGANKGK